jgi:hypothetical protein
VISIFAGCLANHDGLKLRTLFHEFRADLNLDETQKDELRNFLIIKKREVVYWFQKMEYLSKRQSVSPEGKHTLLQMSPPEYTVWNGQSCTHESLSQQLKDNPIGIHFVQGGGQHDNLHTNEVAALLELSREKGGGGSVKTPGSEQHVRMPLHCLSLTTK